MKDMAKHTGVLLRGRVYYLRLHIPKDVRPHLGCGAEKLISLRTTDQAEANLKAAKLRLEWAEKFDAVRCKIKSEPLPELTQEQIQAIVAHEVAALLRCDEEERQRGLTNVEIEFEDASLQELKAETATVLAGRNTESSLLIADAALKEYGYRLLENSKSRQVLAFELTKGISRAAAAIEQRNQGEWVETPTPSNKPFLAAAAQLTGNAETLLTALAKYANEKELEKQTHADYQHKIAEFINFAGLRPISDYTRRDCLGFKEHLLESKLAVRTINTKYLAFVCTVFRYARNNDMRPDNPMEGIKVLQQRGATVEGNAYTKAELMTLFASPVFTQGERQRKWGRTKPLGEAVFWIPLIGLFTGARLNEICQLRRADVIECEYGHYFDLVHEGREDGQRRIKANQGRRVPVHPELIRIGFLEYLRTVPEGGNLFPDLIPDSRGKMNEGFSKWFNTRLLADLGLKQAGRDFHSLRHTLKDAYRECGIPEDVSDALTGHRMAASVGRQYGSGRYPLAPLFEAMQKFKAPIDLSDVTWTKK